MVMEKMNKFKQIPKEFWDDQEWGIEHHSDLVKKYKNRWVAIVNKRVVSAGKDLGRVEEEARKKTTKKHIPVVFVESGSHIYKK